MTNHEQERQDFIKASRRLGEMLDELEVIWAEAKADPRYGEEAALARRERREKAPPRTDRVPSGRGRRNRLS